MIYKFMELLIAAATVLTSAGDEIIGHACFHVAGSSSSPHERVCLEGCDESHALQVVCGSARRSVLWTPSLMFVMQLQVGMEAG